MTIWAMVETIIIGPLKLVYEWIFLYAYNAVGHPGLAIVVLSIIMNIFVLPLYKRADIMQEKALEIEAKLQEGVAHIKKTFSGDERMMVLHTYYRQNHYRPTDALNGSVSLLLEIPFFMAAYQFLSSLNIFDGISFGLISDLSKPDGLLVLGECTVNVLPMVMTLINVISSTIYLKGTKAKNRIQLYAIAFFFLFFLYDSPACLVFYWTLNNTFSLGKNIVLKLAPSKRMISIVLSLVGLLSEIIGLFIVNNTKYTNSSFLFLRAGLILQFPILLVVLKGKFSKSKQDIVRTNQKQFLLGLFFLTFLIGGLIPSNLIAASPQEFVDVTFFYHPIWYVVSSMCLAAGFFLIWMNVFYWIAGVHGKIFFETVTWLLCGITLMNYMFFGTKAGVISSSLQYEKTLFFPFEEQVLNLLLIFILAWILYLLLKKRNQLASLMISIMTIAITGMMALNVVTIKKSVDEINKDALQNVSSPYFQLSSEGKNVIIIMLDRAMGAYVPYIFDEMPDLKEQFNGFTYYSNTISFGGYTNFGIPALMGGYEYTPVEINKRDEEALVSKHNEALKVMPVLFAESGYEVTVCDPVYANYQWIPDLSIYDEYPEINAHITKGKFVNDNKKEYTINNNCRNFFCFGLMKSMPLCLQSTLYDDGWYNKVCSEGEREYSYEFETAYNTLANLSTMTNISENRVNTFLFLANDLTHEPKICQGVDYLPIKYDGVKRNVDKSSDFLVDGRTLNLNNDEQWAHYQTNVTALMLLGEWFDYLRKNNVYDNTRIILVADHGRNLYQLEELILENETESTDVEMYFPLLMVKDFGDNEFVISTEFMTNADVPTLATNSIILNPINPFTKKEINSQEKYSHEQYIILSDVFDVGANSGNTFIEATWACIKENIWEKDNWEFSEEITILKEHELP